MTALMITMTFTIERQRSTMNRSSAIICLLSLATFAQGVRLPSNAVAQERRLQSAALDGHCLSRVEAMVQEVIDDQGIPGLSVAGWRRQ